MQPIPCEVEVTLEDPKTKTSKVTRKFCILLDFVTETITINLERGGKKEVITTVALVQMMGENIIRRAPIDSIRMPELNASSGIIVPGGGRVH